MFYTGRLFEHDFCGQVVNAVDYAKGYKPWQQSAKEVTDNFSRNPETNPGQWDISDPDGMCSDLFYYVSEHLIDLKNMEELRVYPTFGSSFDIFHGVDLFFVFKGRMCTIDLTCNSHKDSCKADVLICPDSDLEEVGKQIAHKLMSCY